MENCRLCSQSTNVFNLLTITDSMKLKLSQTFKINLKSDDSLPKSICQDCNEKLDDSYNFFKHISYVQLMYKGGQDDGDYESHFDDSLVNAIDIKSERVDEPAVSVQNPIESVSPMFLVTKDDEEVPVSTEVSEIL